VNITDLDLLDESTDELQVGDLVFSPQGEVRYLVLGFCDEYPVGLDTEVIRALRPDGRISEMRIYQRRCRKRLSFRRRDVQAR
jgi:hypothetical protein